MYQLTANGGIVRVANGSVIPRDPLNIDYQIFLIWQADGNTPQPYEPPTVDPKEQAKVELAASDKDMARVAEDLINALITKGVIDSKDLSGPATDKLAERAELRKALK